MGMKTFLATTGHGLARTSRSASGELAVEALLTEQDVRCLAANPLNANVLDAGGTGLWGAAPPAIKGRRGCPLGWVDSW